MRLLSTLIDIPHAFYRLWERIHTPTLPNQPNPFEGLDPDRLLVCKARLEGQYQRFDRGMSINLLLQTLAIFGVSPLFAYWVQLSSALVFLPCALILSARFQRLRKRTLRRLRQVELAGFLQLIDQVQPFARQSLLVDQLFPGTPSPASDRRDDRTIHIPRMTLEDLRATTEIARQYDVPEFNHGSRRFNPRYTPISLSGLHEGACRNVLNNSPIPQLDPTARYWQCRFASGNHYLPCAVNPSCQCEGCSDFQPKDQSP